LRQPGFSKFIIRCVGHFSYFLTLKQPVQVLLALQEIFLMNGKAGSILGRYAKEYHKYWSVYWPRIGYQYYAGTICTWSFFIETLNAVSSDAHVIFEFYTYPFSYT